MREIIGSFEALADAVHTATRQKVEQKVEAAKQQAVEIEEQARAEAEQIKQQILAKARRQADQQRSQRLSQAEREANRKRLEARQQILDQVWQQAEEHLHSLVESDEYLQVLRRLTWQAVPLLNGGDLVLAADARGHDLLQPERLAQWSEQAEEAFDLPVTFERASTALETWGGLVISKAQGRKRVDSRFANLLEIARSELGAMIFARLGGDS